MKKAVQPSPAAKPELYATVFVCGAAVMVIEIMGTRIIGPVFGIGLFVWSALLTVTLAALAAGYHSGGILADRARSSRLLGFLVVLAGLLLSVVRVVGHSVLQLSDSFGPRWGALVGATLLFAPALAALGMTGPVAVKQATAALQLAGRSVGSIYAVSTAGSLVGTLALVYLAIPALETDTILTCTAGGLILLGAGSLAARGSAWPLLALVLPALGRSAMRLRSHQALPCWSVRRARTASSKSLTTANRGVRFLRADHSIVGAQFVSDGSAGFAFLHVLEAVRFLRPSAKDALQVGLGIGSLPKVLGEGGVRVDTVEIDPAVARFARKYFGYMPTGDVIVEDARTYLRRTDRRYDIVVHDTFTGGTTPEHLLSLEAVSRIRDLLRPGGVLALNFIGYYDGPNAEASFNVARTIGAVFRNVRVFRDAPLHEDRANPGNLLFFASDGALDFTVPVGARFENEICANILHSFGAWQVLDHVQAGPVITDARNPLSRLQIPIAEKHFYAMNALLPIEGWLQ